MKIENKIKIEFGLSRVVVFGRKNEQ